MSLHGASGAGAPLRRHALPAALALGLLADALVRAPGRPGLGAAAWALAAILVSAWLLGRRAEPSSWETRWCLGGALGFACALALRDAPALAAFGLLSAVLLLALAAGRGASAWVGRATPGDLAFAAMRVGALVAAGPLGWGRAVEGGEVSARWRRWAVTLARGTLLALPAALLLTTLLASADPVFAVLVQDVVRIDVAALIDQAAFALAAAWLAAGYLRALLVPDAAFVARLRVPRLALAPAEISVALWTLNLLFGAFVAVQLRYLFGGADLVEVTPGLTYAEYARRGFFELVAAATLVVPILLIADWAAGGGVGAGDLGSGAASGSGAAATSARRVLRTTMLVLVGLLLAVLASAAYRMALYQQAYGLTELRLYVSVFIGWLAFVFAWLAYTVRRERRERFASGAVVAGLACVGLLHVLNPHAVIARVNLERAVAGAAYDLGYLQSLGADAVPTLVAHLHRLPEAERCRVAGLLEARWSGARPGGWRTWNLGDWRARRMVAAGTQPPGCAAPAGWP